MARARSRDPLWLPDISAMTNGRWSGPMVCLPIRTSRIGATYPAPPCRRRASGPSPTWSGRPPGRLPIGVGEQVPEDQHARETSFSLVRTLDLRVGHAVFTQRLTEVASGHLIAERVHSIVVGRPPPLHINHVADPLSAP